MTNIIRNIVSSLFFILFEIPEELHEKNRILPNFRTRPLLIKDILPSLSICLNLLAEQRKEGIWNPDWLILIEKIITAVKLKTFQTAIWIRVYSSSASNCITRNSIVSVFAYVLVEEWPVKTLLSWKDAFTQELIQIVHLNILNSS